jgi:hypothetical protein
MKHVYVCYRRRKSMISVLPKVSMKVIVAIVVLIVAISFGAIAAGIFNQSDSDGDKKAMEMEMTEETMTVSGQAQEGNEITEPLDFGGAMVHQIKVTFTWEDDNPDSNPDSFSIKLTGQDLEETAAGSASPLEIMIDLDSGESMGSEGEDDCCGLDLDFDSSEAEDEEEAGSEWNLLITLTDGGDQELGPIGLVTIDDTSNPYNIEVEFTYCICCPPEAS